MRRGEGLGRINFIRPLEGHPKTVNDHASSLTFGGPEVWTYDVFLGCQAE